MSCRKIAIVSNVFKVMGNSFQTLVEATERTLPKVSFVLGTLSCCENDDLIYVQGYKTRGTSQVGWLLCR